MKVVKIYTIGLVYWGSTVPFETVRVEAYSEREAFTRTVNYLKPNHMQTLTRVA